MARTATPTPAPRPQRVLVRDLVGAAGTVVGAPEVVLDVRPAFDFLISLVAGPDAELLPVDAAWLEASRASLSTSLARDVALAIGHDESGRGYGLALVNLIVDDPAVRTSADVLALVGRLEAVDLLAAGLGSDVDAAATAVTLGQRVLAGERDLLDDALGALPADSRAMAEPLLRDPGAYLRALRRAVRAWRERFEPIEARIARFGQRDADARRGDLERLPWGEFIERTTGGVRWAADARVRRVILAPGYFCRPYNYVFGGRDWRLFCYPLADAALGVDRNVVPAALVRLHSALGDTSRLRILRLLADGDLYLTEIAERMELSKPTVSHHLARLRASGLVSATESGGLMYYSLQRDRLSALGAELAEFLGIDLAASAGEAPRG